MQTRTGWWAMAIGYPILQLVAYCWGFLTLLAASFGLRDAACYPKFVTLVFENLTLVLVFALPLPVCGAAWIVARCRSTTVRIVAVTPIALILTAYAGTIWAEHLTAVASQDHCAAGHPERQDNNMPVPEVVRTIYHVVIGLLLAAPASAMVAWLLVLIRPLTAALPPSAIGR